MPRRSILILFLVIFFDWVGLGIVFPTLPFFGIEYGASAYELGWLLAIYPLMQRFFAPVWERASDFVGRRPALMLGTLGNALSLLILGFSGSLGWLFIGRAIGGMANANVTLAYAQLADFKPEGNEPASKKNDQRGVIAAASGLGLVFGPAIGGTLSRYGYDLPLFLAASLSFVSFLLCALKLEEPELTPEARRMHHPRRFSWQALQEAWTETKCADTVPIHFLVTLAITQLEAVLCIYLANRYAEDAEMAGVLFSTMGLITLSVQSRTFLSGLRRRVSWIEDHARTITYSCAACAAGMILFSLSSFWVVSILGLILLTAAQGLLLPRVAKIAFTGIADDQRMLTLGLFQTGAGLARILAPPIAGWLFDHISWRSPFYSASATLLVATLVCFRTARRSRFAPSP